MQAYKHQFIELAIQADALKFGEFKLKSGRISPYFFNAGQFNTGQQLAVLGRLYAQALQDATIAYDMLFGPAYKGIPLVSSVAVTLATEYEVDMPYCFNRKLVKSHGEGGDLVGHPLHGKVLIIDDVITAGTAIREAIQRIDTANAQVAAILVMLDRQERGQGALSAVQELNQTLGIPVISIITLSDLMAYLTQSASDEAILKAIEEYRDAYGV